MRAAGVGTLRGQKFLGLRWEQGRMGVSPFLCATLTLQPSVPSPSFVLHWSYWGKLNIFTFTPSCQESCLTVDDIFHLDAGQVPRAPHPSAALCPAR